MDFDCAYCACTLYFLDIFLGEFRSPSFYKFWGGKYTYFQTVLSIFVMYNIEPVRIELLMPFDVLQTCSICVIVCVYVSCLFDVLIVVLICVWLTCLYFPTLLRVEGYQMGCAPGILYCSQGRYRKPGL